MYKTPQLKKGAELLRNIDAEIWYIVTNETGIFLQMITDFDAEILCT